MTLVEIPEFLAEMVRRPAPVPEVVPGSTPVVAFGDARQAAVATLGINPSWREFLDADGSLLSGQKRRLATLAWLKARDTALLEPDQVRKVIDECAVYFQPNRNPYRRWFDPLDQVLRTAFGVSYYDGTACHIDLVQWATVPKWSKLSKSVKHLLLDDGVPHLRHLLMLGKIRIVLLNGRQVVDQVKASGLLELHACGTLPINARRTCSLYCGERDSVSFIGWSGNLQSSWGIGLNFRARLGALLPNVRRGATPETAERQTLPTRRRVDGAGHLIKGTQVADKRELLLVLQAWLIASDAPTIGTGRGQQPWIFISFGDDRTAVLNADTKRAAVEEYVRDAQRRGADVPWHILTNQKSRKWNKLVFRADKVRTPGWYCYLKESADGPGQI